MCIRVPAFLCFSLLFRICLSEYRSSHVLVECRKFSWFFYIMRVDKQGRSIYNVVIIRNMTPSCPIEVNSLGYNIFCCTILRIRAHRKWSLADL